MTFRAYSANKAAAKFDLKRAFKSNLVPLILAIFYAFNVFVSTTLSTFNMLGNEINEPGLAPLKAYLRSKMSCMLVTYLGAGTAQLYCIVIGVLFALPCLFLMRKNSVNFYLSLPVDRATLFKNRLIAAFTCMAGVLFCGIAVDTAINIFYLGNAAYIIQMALALFAECFVYAAVSWSLVVLGIFACYTMVEGALFGLGLLALPTVITAFCSGVFKAFLYGYSRRDVSSVLMMLNSQYTDAFTQPSLLSLTANFNPLTFGKAIGHERLMDSIFFLAGGKYDAGLTYAETTVANVTALPAAKDFQLPTAAYVLPLVIWAVLTGVFVLAARELFIRRKAENTELHASAALPAFIFACEGAMAASLIVLGIFSVNAFSRPLIGAFVVAAVFLGVFYLVLAVNKRKAFFKGREYLPPLGIALAVLAICLSVNAYSLKPVPLQHIEAAVVLGNTDIRFSDVLGNESGVPMTTDARAMGIFTEEEDVKKVLALNNTVANERSRKSTNQVAVMYFLDNGEKVCRKYDNVSTATAIKTLSLTQTKAYQEELAYLLLGDADEKSRLETLCEKYHLTAQEMVSTYIETPTDKLGEHVDSLTYLYQNGVVNFTDTANNEIIPLENTATLRKALYEDLKNSDYAARLNPTEASLGTITFTIPLSYDENGDMAVGDYNFGDTIYRVYPSMTNTVAVLEKAGVLPTKSDDLIVSATVQRAKDFGEFGSVKNDMMHVFSGAGITLQDYQYYYTDLSMSYGTNKVQGSTKLQALRAAAVDYGVLEAEDMLVAFEMRSKDGAPRYEFMLLKAEKVPAFLSK